MTRIGRRTVHISASRCLFQKYTMMLPFADASATNPATPRPVHVAAFSDCKVLVLF